MSDASTNSADESFETVAIIGEWKKTANGGEFGFAQFDRNGKKDWAISWRKVKGIEPILGEPFTCRVESTAKGYSVVEILLHGLEDAISACHGVVSYESNGNSVVLRAMQGTKQRVSLVGSRALNEAGIHEISNGTPIVFSAKRVRGWYELTALHSPLAEDAVLEIDKRRAIHTVVGYACMDWDQPNGNGAWFHFRGDPKAPLAARVWVSKRLLIAAGIKKIVKAKPGLSHRVVANTALLNDSERILRTGTAEEAESLAIDRIEIEAEWIAGKGRWRVQQLLRPRAARVPRGECEIYDWVLGKVVRIEKTAADKQKNTGTADAAVVPALANGERNLSIEEPYSLVHVQFEHDAVGRSEATGNLKDSYLELAGVREGVMVVFQLKSKKSWWNIGKLHRCRTQESISLPCFQN